MPYKFVYDLPFVTDISMYLLFPLLLLVLVLSAILFIYACKHRNEKDKIYKYNVNMYSILICILLTIIFFAIILGFSLAFKIQMDSTGLETVIAYLVLLAPIIPAIVLIYLIAKLIKVYRNKPEQDKNKKDIEII